MEYKLNEIITFSKGFAFKSKDYTEVGLDLVKVSDFTDNSIDIQKTKKLPKEFTNKYTKYKLSTSDILISTVGSWPSNPNSVVGKIVRVPKLNHLALLNQNIAKINLDSSEISYDYLYYLLRTEKFKNYIIGTAQGSANQASITLKDIGDFRHDFPDFDIQKKISNILMNMDSKIKINQKIIANLEELSQTLFKRWFVDFEFPDENGNPYRSSGGEMVDSELGEIPKEWSIQTLNDISESYNTKRKPLSKLEREKVASIYPYYGATKIIDYVDDYLFDGKFILVGEDGTVQTEEGHPFVQYVWGKFWVSNHAHILKGNNLSDEILMLILNNINIEPYITGAVQPKISKKNLNGIKVIIGTKLIYEKFDQYSDIYYKKIREIREETKNLIELRDTLLPKLMSGELEIPDHIEVNEDELSI